MARRAEMVARECEGGPPAVWRIAARVLLVIGLINLVGLVFTGGHFFFAPWLFLPFVFFWIFAGRPGRRGRRERRYRRGAASGPDEDSRDMLPPAGGPEPALDRPQRLEAELAEARRQIRELEAQLSWQARLLEKAPPPEQRPDATAPPA